MPGLPTDWEKLFANNVIYKGLIFKIYKQFIPLNNKKTNPIKNISRRPKQTFLQRSYTDGQMACGKILSITNY